MSSAAALPAAPAVGLSPVPPPAAAVPSEEVFEGAELRSLSFVTLSHGQSRTEVTIAEGELPKAVLEKFPYAAGPLKVWQLPSAPMGLKGEIKLEFEAGKTQGAAGPVLYFFAGSGWKTAELKAGDCGEKMCRYSVSVPYSLYYAVTVKK